MHSDEVNLIEVEKGYYTHTLTEGNILFDKGQITFKHGMRI